MLELMARDPFSPTTDPDAQSHGFTGPAVPRGAKLWSKAGWTSQTRHDAAYIEFANGKKLVLIIFTVNHANERDLIPKLAKGEIGRASCRERGEITVVVVCGRRRAQDAGVDGQFDYAGRDTI